MYIPMKECIAACGGLPFKGVLHIGAHLGEEAKDYLDNGIKDILWIEANPELMPALRQQTNNFGFQTQFYINACLSDTDDEEVSFNVASNGQSSSMLNFGTHAKLYPHIKYTKTIQLQTRKLDTIIANSKVSFGAYDFLNIDIQGAELKAFKGMENLLKKNTIKAIYSEANSEHVYEGCGLVEEIDEYLGCFGFRRILNRGECKEWFDSLYWRP